MKFPEKAEGPAATRIATASRQKQWQSAPPSQVIPSGKLRSDNIASHGIKNRDDLIYFRISNVVLFERKYGVNVRSLEIVICDIEMRMR
jgi:hypothetical protein